MQKVFDYNEAPHLHEKLEQSLEDKQDEQDSQLEIEIREDQPDF